MSGGGAEAGTMTIKEMVGASHSGYTMNKSGACSSRGGGGRQVQRNQREKERDSSIAKDVGRENAMTRITRDK